MMLLLFTILSNANSELLPYLYVFFDTIKIPILGFLCLGIDRPIRKKVAEHANIPSTKYIVL